MSRTLLPFFKSLAASCIFASFIPLASPEASYILYIKYYTEIIFATEKIKFPSVNVFDLQSGMQNKKKTSDFMAGSIGTNPVIVRKILQQLKAAGLVEVSRGTGKGKSKFMGVFLSVMRKFRVILLF